jgi:hypothetical protein
MSIDANIDHATLLEWEYKTPAMCDMVASVLRLALKGSDFTTNDLPIHGEAAHGGSGIAGTVIRRLVVEDILSPVGVFDGDTFIPRTARNAGGNRIGVWRLSNPSLARTLLARHDTKAVSKTEQMALL